MSTPRKPLFKYIPSWSALNSAQTPTPPNQAKTNNDVIHNFSNHASKGPKEPVVWSLMIPSCGVSKGSERALMDGSVVSGRHTDRGDSQGTL
jgi:hypothetical protein